MDKILGCDPRQEVLSFMTKIDIFSGFLGAGKTTLIKKLIAEAYTGEKIVLIENEFGEIAIDGGFLKDSGVQINEMNSGCICCSLVGDFADALQKVLAQFHPDRILIEPSGVGKLSDVIRAVQGVQSDELVLNGFTTVVDANKCRMYMKNFGEFFNNQVENASAIILSRTEGIRPEKLDAAVALLREKNPTATIVTTPWTELDGKQILQTMERRDTLSAELEHLKAEAAEEVTALKAQGVNPCLAVILVGENPASQVYVRGKINDCAQCGIESRSINLPADTTQETLLAEVKKLADDPAVHGILVQLPLPEQIDEKAVIDAIPPEKDVDGFSPINVGRMQIGEPCYLPCTPAGCIRMIESTGTEIAGKNAVVIGRSNIVGKPAALLLLAKNATVTICHSKTKNLKEVCAAADILVAAVGREGFVTGDMVKPGAVVIDVGINRGADGKLHGDVNFAEAGEKAGYITPVPGGVGPMTRAMLMLNTVEAAARQSGKTL